jgi:hypothetical protein
MASTNVACGTGDGGATTLAFGTGADEVQPAVSNKPKAAFRQEAIIGSGTGQRGARKRPC